MERCNFQTARARGVELFPNFPALMSFEADWEFSKHEAVSVWDQGPSSSSAIDVIGLGGSGEQITQAQAALADTHLPARPLPADSGNDEHSFACVTSRPVTMPTHAWYNRPIHTPEYIHPILKLGPHEFVCATFGSDTRGKQWRPSWKPATPCTLPFKTKILTSCSGSLQWNPLE